MSMLTSKSKHAFCIMAHEKWSQLQKLIDCIDDERNDIYLHIDAKSLEAYHQYGGVNTICSNLFFVDNPVDVEWSDVSLCDAEVRLYEKVLVSGVSYQYVHLLSGADLPVMNPNEMHTFLDLRDEELIDVRYNPNFKKRIKYYHFFVRGRRNSTFKDLMRMLLLIPQLLFVDRLKNVPIKYAYGSEWCSLTLKAVKEIVAKYGQYRHMFEKTTGSDELYKQMILVASDVPYKFAKEGNLRYVRFDHGKASPRIISMKEYDDIIHSGCLFARKFKEGTEAFEKMYKNIQEKQ